MHGAYGHDGWSIILFEFTEPTSVDDTCNDVPHVEGLADIGAHDAVKFVWRVEWRFRRARRLNEVDSETIFVD